MIKRQLQIFNAIVVFPLIFTLFVMWTGALVLAAGTNTWTGAVDTNWGTAGNWSDNAVPAAMDGKDCLIPSGLANYPVVGTGDFFECDGILTISSGAQLTTLGNDFSGVTVIVDGTWISGGFGYFDFAGDLQVNVNAGGKLLLDNTSMGSFSSITNTVTVAGTLQISGTSSLYRGTRLVVNKGGVVDILSGGAFTIQDGGTITNNGTIKQTQTVTGPTEFLRITNNATTTLYYGTFITPTAGNLLTTTVSIQGNQSCFGFGSTVARCYEITPNTVNPATVRFYYSSGEANGNTAPNAYHWNGTSWDALPSTRGGSGIAMFVEATNVISYSPFALSDTTPVALIYLPIIIHN